MCLSLDFTAYSRPVVSHLDMDSVDLRRLTVIPTSNYVVKICIRDRTTKFNVSNMA